eukprot:5075533-Lingulodinium_polyedra.AAC.1
MSAPACPFCQVKLVCGDVAVPPACRHSGWRFAAGLSVVGLLTMGPPGFCRGPGVVQQEDARTGRGAAPGR